MWQISTFYRQPTVLPMTVLRWSWHSSGQGTCIGREGYRRNQITCALIALRSINQILTCQETWWMQDYRTGSWKQIKGKDAISLIFYPSSCRCTLCLCNVYPSVSKNLVISTDSNWTATEIILNCLLLWDVKLLSVKCLSAGGISQDPLENDIHLSPGSMWAAKSWGEMRDTAYK